MLEKLVEKCEGRELLSKRDLKSNETGVEVRSGNLFGLYAFPDESRAYRFLDDAPIQFVMETEEFGTATLFDRNVIQRALDKLGRLKDRFLS